ncbi:MAG: hypothetical protein M3Z03_09580 [Actinomycetota bacterium]|nr:hypothetical protein [Actinomycetota bacterium]
MNGSALVFVRRLLLLAGLVVLVAASPAAADAAGPSDFRSTITELAPPVEGVSAEIRGGDSFLELDVDDGVEVVVVGYNGEPYLRFLPDGTVERNRWSTATYINDDRKGAGTIPDKAQDPETAPAWEEVGSGGTYAWHDHRIHWMSDVSPRVERGSRVGGAYDPWEVPLEVDGQAVAVRGILTYEEAASPLPWIAAAVVALAAVLAMGRRAPIRTASIALLAMAALGVVVGRGEFAGTPDGGANPLLWVLPIVALATAAGSVALRRKPSAVVLTLASVATLSGWALLRIKVLTKPVLPTELPFQLDRATTAAALAVAVASAYLAVSSGALKLPELADDDTGS